DGTVDVVDVRLGADVARRTEQRAGANVGDGELGWVEPNRQVVGVVEQPAGLVHLHVDRDRERRTRSVGVVGEEQPRVGSAGAGGVAGRRIRDEWHARANYLLTHQELVLAGGRTALIDVRDDLRIQILVGREAGRLADGQLPDQEA